MHKKIFLQILVTLYFLVCACGIYADTPEVLYTAQVPVKSDDTKNRLDVLPEALQQVLVKVSGNLNITNIPQLNSQLPSANAFLQSYSYKSYNNENGQKSLYLQVEFDSQSINTLLQEAGQKIWSEERPQIIVWLATSNTNEKDNKIKIITKNNNDFLVNAFEDYAIRFGLPITWPTLDHEDTLKISAINICHLDTTTLQSTIQKYPADLILAACLNKSGTSWSANWKLIYMNHIEKWESKADNIDQLLNISFQKIFSIITNLSANSESAQDKNHIVLHVSNVNSLEEYSKIINYLRKFHSVKQIQLAQVRPNEIDLSIIYAEDIKKLQDSIQQDNHMLIAEPNKNTDTEIFYIMSNK